MSKDEVKEEMKQSEGDPQIKGKIKQKQRQMAMQRMMKEVPKADVVLLGPQVKYALPEVKKIADEYGKKIEAINMVDYGMMNGKKVLDQALSLIG